MFTLELGKWAQDWKDVTLTGVCSFHFTSLQVEETEYDLTFKTFFLNKHDVMLMLISVARNKAHLPPT